MTIPATTVDLFAGPGGWAEGLRLLGLTEAGLERDAAACATRVAAGHRMTVRCDVAAYPTAPFAGRARTVIASPPCQAWSRAGKRFGIIDQPLVHQAVADLAADRDTRATGASRSPPPRSSGTRRAGAGSSPRPPPRPRGRSRTCGSA